MEHQFKLEQNVWIMHQNKPEAVEIVGYVIRKNRETIYHLEVGNHEVDMEEAKVFKTKQDLINSL